MRLSKNKKKPTFFSVYVSVWQRQYQIATVDGRNLTCLPQETQQDTEFTETQPDSHNTEPKATED